MRLTKVCIDCGESFTCGTNRALRCRPCGNEANKESARRWSANNYVRKHTVCLIDGCSEPPTKASRRCIQHHEEFQASRNKTEDAVAYQSQYQQRYNKNRTTKKEQSLAEIAAVLAAPQTHFTCAQLQRARVGGEFEEMVNRMLREV